MDVSILPTIALCVLAAALVIWLGLMFVTMRKPTLERMRRRNQYTVAVVLLVLGAMQLVYVISGSEPPVVRGVHGAAALLMIVLGGLTLVGLQLEKKKLQ
jgi:amino acid transporter